MLGVFRRAAAADVIAVEGLFSASSPPPTSFSSPLLLPSVFLFLFLFLGRRSCSTHRYLTLLYSDFERVLPTSVFPKWLLDRCRIL